MSINMGFCMNLDPALLVTEVTAEYVTIWPAGKGGGFMLRMYLEDWSAICDGVNGAATEFLSEHKKQGRHLRPITEYVAQEGVNGDE